MSGFKINFHKSEVYCLGSVKEKENSYGEIFTCVCSKFPMKYLGMPIDEKKVGKFTMGPCG